MDDIAMTQGVRETLESATEIIRKNKYIDHAAYTVTRILVRDYDISTALGEDDLMKLYMLMEGRPTNIINRPVPEDMIKGQIDHLVRVAQRQAKTMNHDKIETPDLMYACAYALCGQKRLQGVALPPLEAHLAKIRDDFVKKRENYALVPTKKTGHSPLLERKLGLVSEEDLQTLEKYGSFLEPDRDLNFFGRSNELDLLSRRLQQVRKPNALIIGEEGTGKTALVEALAATIAPAIYSLDISKVVAGTMYRGEFEKRMKEIVDIFAKHKDRLVLFADEFHTILGAGRAGGSLDASNILKPALGRGELKMIGATTQDEFRKYVETDRALLRRFGLVTLKEPDRATTIEMLRHASGDIAAKQGVVFDDDVFLATYTLAKRFIPNRTMPDIAFDILDEAAVLARKRSRMFDLPVSVEDIATVVSEKSGVPAPSMLKADSVKVKGLGRDLKEQVIGQDNVIDQFAAAVKNVWAGLAHDGKGVRGSFLFAGPTGVGKTEVAKLTAQFLNMPLLRFDMSEYMERHNAAKLTGAPPGYVNSDQGGVLTEAVRKNPHCVLLLDEVEKAHPDVYNILLQVLDNGFLKDGLGREIDFRNVIIIMTTNAGQRDVRPSIGFTASKSDAPDSAIKQFFSPEFRNRLDDMLDFAHLEQHHAEEIAKLILEKASDHIYEQNGITLRFDASVAPVVAEKGFSRENGARPMIRYVTKNVTSILSDPILDGIVEKGDRLCISFSKANSTFEWVNESPSAAIATPGRATPALLSAPAAH